MLTNNKAGTTTDMEKKNTIYSGIETQKLQHILGPQVYQVIFFWSGSEV